MAIRQYIGARYIPRFMGEYDATTAYEVLDVVDNGMGTSYILKSPAPAGTPLSDGDHWALYGAVSGAIINLQNQIGTLDNLTTNDKDNLVEAINEIDAKILAAICPTVEILKTLDLAEDDIVYCSGYHSIGDGGSTMYIIQNTSNDFTIQLDNGLYAYPITDRPTPEVFGAYCDENHDDASAIELAIKYVLFRNPLDNSNFERFIGGGTVFFNAKNYYVNTTLSLLGCAHIKFKGASAEATTIVCNDRFGVVDYSYVSGAAELRKLTPFNMSFEDLTFTKRSANNNPLIEIDKPYGVRFTNCRFINPSSTASPYYGYAIQLSTIVDVQIDNCTFMFFNTGVLVTEYGGTYPAGISQVNQNTTFVVSNSIIAACNIGIDCRFSGSGYIQSLTCENDIFEVNAIGVRVSAQLTSHPSQVNFKNCYLEQNSTYSIDLTNACITFDESNYLNRPGDSYASKIHIGSQAMTGQNDPVFNYIVAHLDSDLAFDGAVDASKFFYDYHDTYCKTPYRLIDTRNRFIEFYIAAVALTTYINPVTHPNAVVTAINDHTYWIAKADVSATPNTFTVIQADSNITIPNYGAITTSDNTKALIRANW